MFQYLALLMLVPLFAGCDWCGCSKKDSQDHTAEHKNTSKHQETKLGSSSP